MADPRIELWARTLVEYSTEVRPGDVVAITGGVAAEPLLRAIYREVINAGGHPVLAPSLGGVAADLIGTGSDEQLAAVTPIERFLQAEADVLISVGAETNTRANSGVDPARQRVFDAARAELRQTFMRRQAEGAVRRSSTLYPTDAYAQDAELATDDFVEFVFAACKLNEADPAAAWRRLRDDQQRLIDWLADKDEIHLSGPDTDLTLSVGAGPGSTRTANAISPPGKFSPDRSKRRRAAWCGAATRS